MTERVTEEQIVEWFARWLHDETDHPESYPNYTWPETDRDDGQRDGGFVKIVPQHAQAYFRDIARRGVSGILRRVSSAAGAEVVARPRATWANRVIKTWTDFRNSDHEDNAVISRSDVITLLDEIRRLEAAHPPASALPGRAGERITGATDEVDEIACYIWTVLCPDMVMGDDDAPHYRAAAQFALNSLHDEIQSSDGGVEGHAAVPAENPTQRSGASRDPLGDGSVKLGPHREDAAGVESCPSEARPVTPGERNQSNGGNSRVTLWYRNYRGEVSCRSIVPERVWFGVTEWHHDQQWFLRAYDTDKHESRDFALQDFDAVPAPPQAEPSEEAGWRPAISILEEWLAYHEYGPPIKYTPARQYAADALRDCIDLIKSLPPKGALRP